MELYDQAADTGGVAIIAADVLSAVSEGKQNKVIAAELDLSEHTVKLHIHNVITKLGVNNRTEAAIRFLASQPEPSGDSEQ